MKQLFTLIIFLLITLCIGMGSAQAQQFQWVHGGGTTFEDATLDNHPEATEYMCTDANGNVYALSHVAYTTIHADTFSFTPYLNDFNLLVTSYNCSGQMRWAKVITSSDANCNPFGIVADSSGHIYIGGTFPNADLRIGYDTVITTSEDLMLGVIQLDTSGHFNWIRHVGNNTITTFYVTQTTFGALSLDGNNNIHLLPYIGSGSVLAPGDTSHQGIYDINFNSSGSLLSVKKLQLDSTLGISGAIIDPQSNKLYAYGYRGVEYWTAYGGDSSYHAYIAEFDTARNQVWMDTLGDYGTGGDQGFSSVVPDGKGNLYLLGLGNEFLIYRGDTITTLPGTAGYISAIIKTDTAGNFKWLKQYNGNSLNQLAGITLMPNGKIGAAGTFVETVTCGPVIIHSDANYDPYFTIIDTNATLITLQRINGDGYLNNGNTLTSDKIGNLYIGGEVVDSIPDTLITSYHSVGGNTDFFVLKYGVDCGCTAMPVAAYTTSGTSTVTATYTGTTASGIDSVVWNFGDGTTGSGISAIHVYTTSGTVDLCVTVYTGCGYDIHCSNITVNCTGTITASFTDTGSTTRGFTYTGTTAALDSIHWDFGDGHGITETSASTVPLHTYSISGTYTVCATVYTGCGSNTDCHIVVINCSPVSSFTHSGTDPVSFTYTGTSIGLDSVVWSFGDGHTGNGTTASHTYSLSGTYTVCATAYAVCGTNTDCNTVVVNCSPVSSFTYSGSDPVSFTFTGSAFGLDSVTWNFGDGTTGTGTTPSHIYSASGTYSVCATVYGTCGSTTSCQDIVVSCSPTSSFTHSGTDPVDFTFTGSAYGLDSVVWGFDDGSTATGTSSSHVYSASGTYTVCATVYATCGATTSCEVITIDCTPVPSFAITGTITKDFTYTGTTTGLDSVTWTYGDGSTGDGTTTSHTYTATGTYTVCATAHTGCGNATTCSTVTINCLTAPVAAFIDTGGDPRFFGYIGTTAGYDSLVWTFGDGSSYSGVGTAFSVTHTYSDSGTYEACVTVYTGCGIDSSCKDIMVLDEGVQLVSVSTIQVYPNPVGDELNVTGVVQNMSYRLLSVTGVCVAQGVLHIGSNIVSMKNAVPGVYVLEITDVDGNRNNIRIVKD